MSDYKGKNDVLLVEVGDGAQLKRESKASCVNEII